MNRTVSVVPHKVSHREFCTMCGAYAEMFEINPNRGFNHHCAACNATIKYRGQAAALLSLFGKGRYRALAPAVRGGAFKDLDIYEVAIKGPLQRLLRQSERYTHSYYWEDVAPGDWHNGVQCQDLTQLTYGDASFDLVISTEVMEHVRDPGAAFAEIARVLRAGGVYVFTIPVRLPLAKTSTVRARIDASGAVEHLLPKVYHNSGTGGKALVFTEFGADIFDNVAEFGLRLSCQMASTAVEADSRFCTFIAHKLA